MTTTRNVLLPPPAQNSATCANCQATYVRTPVCQYGLCAYCQAALDSRARRPR